MGTLFCDGPTNPIVTYRSERAAAPDSIVRHTRRRWPEGAISLEPEAMNRGDDRRSAPGHEHEGMGP
jgi:hypothetical protein